MKEVSQNDNDFESMESCRSQLLAVHDAVEILSGKWKVPIMAALIQLREARFKELQQVVGKITPKMLSKELKELELNAMVERSVFETTPVTVKYSITDHGESCKPVIKALRDWGLYHRKSLFGT